MKRVYFILLLLFMYSCEKSKDHFISVVNNNDKLICIFFDSRYPSDSLSAIKCLSHNKPDIVFPYSSDHFTYWGTGKPNSWYLFYEEANDYDGYISVYIGEIDMDFYESSFDERGFPEITFEVPVIARYDIRKKDIEVLNWVISFPPSEAMKDIHMWPPYEQIVQTDE